MTHALHNAHQLATLRGRNQVGPPVVLVHGISGSINVWPAMFSSELLDRLNWCSLSLPGHFPSTHPAEFQLNDVTPELFSQSMMDEIDRQFPKQRVHLVGWSTGGFAVLNLAATFPDRIASVLSIAGYARGRWSGSLGWLQTMAHSGKVGRLAFRRFFARLGVSRQRFVHSMTMLTSNRSAWKSSRLTEPVMDAMFSDFVNHDYAVFAALFARIRDFDITNSLKQIAAEVLIVNGENDPAIPATEARWLIDVIPDAKLHIIPNCGHMFFAEAEEQFASIFADWIAHHRLLA